MKSHKCHKDGCDAPALDAVRLHLICRAWGVVQPVSMNCSIRVCAEHRDDVRPFVLSPENRKQIVLWLGESGYAEPDFFSARLEFVPIASIEPQAPLIVRLETCDREGCGNPARWQIVQRLRVEAQQGCGEPMLNLLTGLRVCDRHRAETTVADINDNDSRTRTRKYLQGKNVHFPDFKTMTIDFVPLDKSQPVNPIKWVGPKQPFDAVG